MKPEDNKIVCRFCKQPITGSYTTYTFTDCEDYIMCDIVIHTLSSLWIEKMKHD